LPHEKWSCDISIGIEITRLSVANFIKMTSRLRLRISPAAESILRAGHPWLFADSIREQNRDGRTGELAVVYDRKDQFLAIGLFDADSPIRVRVLHAGKPQTIDSAWWSDRLQQTIRRRDGLFDKETNGFRLINGESDGWPALVLDRYSTMLVLKIYSAAWLPRLDEVISLVRERLNPERIVLRFSRNIPEGDDGKFVYGTPPGGSIIFSETGLQFEADVVRGQKTGFFLDQRENRRLVESLARGRTVLNAFSFSGGFSLYAARGGAASVADLDISAHALASAGRNFELNQSNAVVTRCRREAIQADAFEWLKANERQFDLIILDPPSFAKRESERDGAIRAYERLVSLGVSRLARNGILLACSCSAHVSAEEFFDAVRRSAANSGRKFAELRTTRHAPDHPATFKEAEYLKGSYLAFD
jgi:23S rRNA (cytosine1962-C5)-methyltransferase